jgi:hypothetical protein
VGQSKQTTGTIFAGLSMVTKKDQPKYANLLLIPGKILSGNSLRKHKFMQWWASLVKNVLSVIPNCLKSWIAKISAPITSRFNSSIKLSFLDFVARKISRNGHSHVSAAFLQENHWVKII